MYVALKSYRSFTCKQIKKNKIKYQVPGVLYEAFAETCCNGSAQWSSRVWGTEPLYLLYHFGWSYFFKISCDLRIFNGKPQNYLISIQLHRFLNCVLVFSILLCLDKNVGHTVSSMSSLSLFNCSYLDLCSQISYYGFTVLCGTGSFIIL